MIIRNFHKRSTLLCLLLFACFQTTLLISPARATIMQYLEVEDLARLSSDIFHGQVISTVTYWNDQHTRIYTSVRVRIDESFKGSTRRSEIITVTQLGGERDGVKMDYSGRPEFSVGESVILFTERGKNNDFVVIGLKQGKMRVEGSEVTRDFSGITLVDRASQGRNPQPIAVKSNRIRLDELRNRIARAR